MTRESVDRPWYLQKGHLVTGFVLHCASGVLAVAAHYGLMFLAIELGAAPLAATSIGFVAGALTRFFLAHFHIFTPSDTVPVTAAKFSVALGAQFIANGLIFSAFEGLSLGVWAAQVSTTVTLTVANYLVYRYWVFKS